MSAMIFGWAKTNDLITWSLKKGPECTSKNLEGKKEYRGS